MQTIGITRATKLAKEQITVEYHGGYYVSEPSYPLSSTPGTIQIRAPRSDWARARAVCREKRIGAVVQAVTGSSGYASECERQAIHGHHDGEDWRVVARRMVRAYKSEGVA